MQQLTHVDQSGQASMVDVSQKAVTSRQATATALLQTTSQVIQLIELQLVKKGDVLSTARLAGIMAAKQTSQLIPLCHPLPLSQVQVPVSTTCRRVVPTPAYSSMGSCSLR